MSKISIYEATPVPKLADKLIGTSVGGEPEDITYNFTLSELLNLFIPNIPQNTLQGVLDYGNEATQDIILNGTIYTTNLEVSDNFTILNSFFTGETHILGGLYDSLDSIGTPGQVLTSTGTGVEWYSIPTIIPDLQQVLTSGNTADVDIVLDANLDAVIVSADTAIVGSQLSVQGVLVDYNESSGSAGQVLVSGASNVEWVDLPVYTATSPLSIDSITRVISIQQAGSTQDGYLSSADWISFDGKQSSITLTTTGSSGPSTLIGDTLNIPDYGSSLIGYVPYTGATNNVDLGAYNLTAFSLIKAGGLSSQFLKADGTVDSSNYITLNSLSAYPPISYNNITGEIAIAMAGSSTNGYLSSTDWVNFNNKQDVITLTTTGSSGPSTFFGNILNIPDYGSVLSGYVPTSRQLSINGITYDLTTDRSWSVGTVVSVAALTLDTIGMDLSSTVDNSTNTPVITLNVPTASAVNRGALSAADWSTFNTKVGDVTASSPLFSSGGSTPNITIQQSSGSQDGYLSSTDWTTFNNKQAAGNYITSLTGEATATGPGAAAVTLNNASVTGKVLTGVNITGGSVQATDTMLTAFGKLQNQINGLIGSTIYQGTWNASTNTPTLVSGVGVRGYYYIVSVAGTTNLDGITDWFVGDWAIFDGTAWQQVDNTDAVVSVNGQTGAVSLTTDNIAEGATNKYFLDSRARAALSFTAGSGAYNSTTGVITIPTNNNQLTNGAAYITLGSLSASSPLSYNSGTGAFSISQANTTTNGFLSSTDWNTFNSKQSALTFSSPLVNTAGTISIPAASGSVNGYLSSTDWTTFNSKQNALSGTGFVKISGTTISYDNSTYYLASNPNAYIPLTALSAGAGISYNNTTGVIASTITQYTDAMARASISGGTGISYNSTTGVITNTITQYTDALARAAISLTTTGTSGAATYNSTTGVLNVPQYAPDLSGYVPTSRTITINGTSFDLSANRSYSVGTVTSVGLSSATSGVTIGSTPITSSGTITLAIATASSSQQGLLSSSDWTTFNNKQSTLTNPVTGTGASGQVTFFNGTSTVTGSNNHFWDATNNRLGIGLVNPQRALEIYSATADSHLRLSGNAPSVSLGEAITGSIYQAKFGLATANGQYATGAVAGDFVILSQTGATIFATNATEKMRVSTAGNVSINNTNNTYRLDVTGTSRFSGQLTLGSTITNGTYTYTLPSATGTLALVGGAGVGTVTSVGLSSATSGVTIGSSPITSSGTITLAIATASSSQQGLLSSTDWTTFNNKQNALTNPVTGTGTTNYLPKFTGTSTIGNSVLKETSGNIQLDNTSAVYIANSSSTSYFGGLSIRQSGTEKARFAANSDEGTYIYSPTFEGFSILSDARTFLRLNASGNLGLGVTPSAWVSYSGRTALQVGITSVSTNSANDSFYGTNYYDDGSNNRYINSDFSLIYAQQNGNHIWYSAPSGTAGNAISFTQAMTLNASGNLSVGNTNDTYRLDVTGRGRFTHTAGVPALDIRASDSNFALMSVFGNQTGDVNWLIMSGYPAAGDFTIRQSDTVNALTLAKTTGAATFSSSVTAGGRIISGPGAYEQGGFVIPYSTASSDSRNWKVTNDEIVFGDFAIKQSTTQTGETSIHRLYIKNNGNVGISTTSPSATLHVNGTIQTGAPTDGTAQPWKLGAIETGTCVPSNFGDFASWFTGTVVQISVNGTTYRIPVVNSNYC